MSDIPNRALSPEELKEFEKAKKLEKAVSELDLEYTRRAQLPSRVFGILLTCLVVALFIDISGWMGAFLDGGLYYVFACLLTVVESLSVFGMAGLAIYGSIEAYKHQQRIRELDPDDI